MSVRPILNYFNRLFFFIRGLGSTNYHKSNFKTTLLFYILRCAFIFGGLKTIYQGNKIVRNIFNCIKID